jgi:hypothetical protein
METVKVVHEEKNRLTKVLGLVAVVMAFAQSHKLDAAEIIENADAKEWDMFRALASKVAGREISHPSDESKALVRHHIREAHALMALLEGPQICIACGLRPATRESGKSGRAGTNLCEGCWKLDTDHGGDA